ncbi:MAG TPA: hypothetical protein VHG91_05625 [Longimicrobium sp.]|nr:hypothetical protein [Longimicrobium sp.]
MKKRFRSVLLALTALGVASASPTREAAAFTPLNITDVYCLPNGASYGGGGTGSCVATVTGGTGVYTYSWEPEPVSTSGSRARIPCVLGSYQNVWLTVTDSNGATDFFATSFFCGEGA